MNVMTLLQEVDKAMASMEVAPEDAGTAALIRRYAWEIDKGEELQKLGPPLLAAMEALGMSPRARALLKGGKVEPPRNRKLDELRERRARKHEPKTVDSPAP
jgi:hypothetical protein